MLSILDKSGDFKCFGLACESCKLSFPFLVSVTSLLMPFYSNPRNRNKPWNREISQKTEFRKMMIYLWTYIFAFSTKSFALDTLTCIPSQNHKKEKKRQKTEDPSGPNGPPSLSPHTQPSSPHSLQRSALESGSCPRSAAVFPWGFNRE